MNNKKKEPLIHITRRKDISWQTNALIRVIGIIAALIVCGIITSLTTGLNPLSVYGTMLDGSFGSSRKLWVLGKDLAILLAVSLALTPAFRMKFWNLGGEGQVLIGCLATATCMLKLGAVLPAGLLILVELVLALVAGAVWAFIPAFFKARWNTNETLFTLMMNYVAIQLVAYFVILWENPKGSGKMGIINGTGYQGWLPAVGGQKYLLIIVVVAVLTAALHVYLKYSKHGYEISVVGESHQTAKYIGIKVDRVIMRTLIVSGAICGITGWLIVAGSDHTLTTSLAGGRGFMGVMVAWLAHFNPLMMVLASFLLVFMEKGAGQISTAYGLNQSFGDILTGIILFFIIGTEFFINYKIHFRGKAGKEEK